MYASVSVMILWYLIMIPFYQNAYTYMYNSYRNGVSEHVKCYGMRAIKLRYYTVYILNPFSKNLIIWKMKFLSSLWYFKRFFGLRYNILCSMVINIIFSIEHTAQIIFFLCFYIFILILVKLISRSLLFWIFSEIKITKKSSLFIN